MERRRRPAARSLAAPRWWPAWVLVGSLWLVAQLPFRWQLAIGRGLGHGLYRLLPGRRAVVLRNLALCFPELDAAARRRLARAHFASVGMGVIELGMCWWAPDARLRGRLRVEGMEHLERARAGGRGVLLASGHFTSIDISGRLFAPVGPPMHVLYRRQRNPVLDLLLRRSRERIFAGAIPRDDMRGMVRTLRGGGIVWYAGDQAYGGPHAALVPFFGIPAATNTAVSRLAAMGKAAVVPAFMERDAARGIYTVRLLPALDGFPSADPVADTARVLRCIEQQIRRCPEQYFWMHKRFKKRSAEYPDPYAAASTPPLRGQADRT